MLQVAVITLAFLFTSFCQVTSYESFNDFPMTLERGNYVISAVLNDLSSGTKYVIEEKIHANESVQGAITIISDEMSSITVHYDTASSNQRLVIQDYDCSLYTYKSGWDKKLPGITRPLGNHIMLVGPSLIYRLKHKSLVWKNGFDTQIRGTTMHSAYAMTTANRLNITYYYKDTMTAEIGLTQPSRIEFSGFDPSDYSSTVKQTLVLDIYVKGTTDIELDKEVGPKTGIGCPIYFTTNKRFFDLVRDSVHFISMENVVGPKTSNAQIEVYADESQQLASIKAISQGITTEAIYDYTLGLVYTLNSDNGCSITSMQINTLGVGNDFSSNKPMKISFILNTNLTFQYLGETWFNGQTGFTTDVWESIQYNYTISSGKYDKVVTTIFTADSKNGDTSSDSILVGTTINAYNKASTGVYTLVETTKKTYYDFGQEITDEEYEDRFRISDCYPSNTKTLAIQFECRQDNCDEAVKKYYYAYREKIKSAIVDTGVVSASRIGDIDIVLDSDKIVAYVTFIGFPRLTSAFQADYLPLSSDVFSGTSKTSAASAEDCITQNANMGTSFEAVVYCRKDQLCGRINKISSIVEDTKSNNYCTVYYIPLRNLYRYNRETALDKLQSELKDRGLGFYFYDGYNLVQYSVYSIYETKADESESRQLYEVELYATKLVEDGTSTVMATSANSLADCYRACSGFEDVTCETFSFCQWAEKTECLLSTSVFAKITEKLADDSSCQLYRKNHISDYMKIGYKAFINPTSTAMDSYLRDCSDACYYSDECFAFQFCYGECTFGGHYSDANARYSYECDIYIPKVAEKFSPTGTKISAETYHTEMKLTLDQCAALCYDSDVNEGACVSFNFCPGSKVSSCYLSKYSVKDASTKTSESNVCVNYERDADESNNGGNKKVQTTSTVGSVKGTGVGATLGIIMLFVAVGLVFGFAAPFVYNKSRATLTDLTSPKQETEINWNRHLNEEDEQVNVL